MKKIVALIALSLVSACNNAAPDEAIAAEEPISLNEITQPLNETPVKKDMDTQQRHEIAITVPDGTWNLSIQDVLETETETAVIVKLSQTQGVMGIQVISEVITALEFESEKPVKVYVLGKKWNWKNTERYEFVEESFNFSGRPISYQEVEPSRKGGPKKQMIGTPLD